MHVIYVLFCCVHNNMDVFEKKGNEAASGNVSPPEKDRDVAVVVAAVDRQTCKS